MMDRRSRYCVCSFMQKLIVIGGCKDCDTLNSCMAYDIKTNKWTYIASMNVSRKDTSCTVFQGKVVVTGGWIRSSFRYLKSVEAYCFHENKWTQLPDMLKKRCNSSTVSIGNKMFVISNADFDNSEVFDSITNKFTLLKKNPHINNIDCYLFKIFAIAIPVGYKIHVFIVEEYKEKRRVSLFCYDIIEKSWTSDDTCNNKCYDSFSCANMFKR